LTIPQLLRWRVNEPATTVGHAGKGLRHLAQLYLEDYYDHGEKTAMGLKKSG
jgi:hypothetical protein